MRIDEFREWLRLRGNSANSVNSKMAAVRKIETELAALGSAHGDLDTAYEDDRFTQLRRVLNEIRSDYRNGGNRFQLLFPDSNNPVNRIANPIAWLGQYDQFRRNLGQHSSLELDSSETYWLVGASFGRNEDQVERFRQEGIWEIRTPKDNEAAAVRSMKIGDRIAIKSAFVQKLNLPFDNRGKSVSVMRVKARGTITANRKMVSMFPFYGTTTSSHAIGTSIRSDRLSGSCTPAASSRTGLLPLPFTMIRRIGLGSAIIAPGQHSSGTMPSRGANDSG